MLILPGSVHDILTHTLVYRPFYTNCDWFCSVYNCIYLFSIRKLKGMSTVRFSLCSGWSTHHNKGNYVIIFGSMYATHVQKLLRSGELCL